MGDLLVLGAGGHCRALIDVIEREGKWTIAGIVDAGIAPGTEVFGYPALGDDARLAALSADIGHAIIGVGQIRSPEVRKRLYAHLIETGYTLPTIVSPSAEVSRRAVLGPGSVAMHFAAAGPNATIGVNAILNSRALVEHDCRIGDHCHISTGAILNGGVSLGDGSFVGSGSVVREGIAIGPGAFVAMGSRVTHDLGPNTEYRDKQK